MLQFEPETYSVSETGGGVILGVARHGSLNRTITAVFNTQSLTAEGQDIYSISKILSSIRI